MTSNYTTLNYEKELFERFPKVASTITDQEILNLIEGSKDIDLKQLFLDANKQESGHIKVQPLINGNFIKMEKTNFQSIFGRGDTEVSIDTIKKLESSLRITNIQKLNKEVSNCCMGLTKLFKLPVTCNMYITPNSKFRGLTTHSDDQVTFVLQVLGEKQWTIYQEENGEDLIRTITLIDYENETSHSRNIILKEGEVLYVPYNTVHLVECLDDTPSIHLAFALNITGNFKLYQYVLNEVSMLVDKVYDLHAPTNKDSVEGFLKDFEEATKKLDYEEIARKYKDEIFKNSISLIKSGRRYS